MMELSLRYIGLCILLLCTFTVSAANQCSRYNCDCESLPASSWVEACQSQESRMIADCLKEKASGPGYCTVHGPMANRLPLALDIEDMQIEVVGTDEVPTLSNKVAALYWAVIKDFDWMQSFLQARQYEKAEQKLATISMNAETLFETQLQITRSLKASGQDAIAERAWRDYSPDSLGVASDLFVQANAILNTYDDMPEEDRLRYRDIGLKLMSLSGKVFEQVGYAYATGMRHKHAAKAWKNAADASALMLAHGEGATETYYRYQSAARLHRASYHWVIGLGRGNAEQSLVESQRFMDDASSLMGLVEEEKHINATKPYWSP